MQAREESITTLRRELRSSLRDEEYRHAYADEQLNLSISTQIKVIREQQGMKQDQLADKIGTKQGGVSRLESANYAGWSIAALRRLARAFDLRLRVSFEEFGTLWQEVATFSRETLQRKSFCNDPEFWGGPLAEVRRRVPRKRPMAGHHRRRYIKRNSLKKAGLVAVAPVSSLSDKSDLRLSGITGGNNNSETPFMFSPHGSNNSTAMTTGGFYGNRL